MDAESERLLRAAAWLGAQTAEEAERARNGTRQQARDLLDAAAVRHPALREILTPAAPALRPSGTGRMVIHTDGACSGNPGPGGWAVVVGDSGPPELALWGGAPDTTNNRMEMTAMLRALDLCARTPRPAVIRSDSEYVLKGLWEWVPGWKARGWRTAAGKPVLNQDLWEALDAALTRARTRSPELRLEHVRGHAGHAGNESADAVAVEARKRVAVSGAFEEVRTNQPDVEASPSR